MDTNDATQVLSPTQSPPDSTIIATVAGATQMGQPSVCAVCGSNNSTMESYCSECGFLLSSTPGVPAAEEGVAVSASGSIRLTDSASGRTFILKQGQNLVGRENAEILLMDSTVSRRHAQVSLEGATITVTDLGSTNGTQVDGERLAPNAPKVVASGAQLRFGNAALSVDLGAANQPAEVGAAPAEPTVALEAASGTGGPEASVPEVRAETTSATTTSAPIAFLRPVKAGNVEIALHVGAVLSVGRRVGNDVVIADPFVSGSHAEIACTAGEAYITDLGSTNGTSVNGQRLNPNQRVDIMEGDTVVLGETEYRMERAPVSPGEPLDAAQPVDLSDATLPGPLSAESVTNESCDAAATLAEPHGAESPEVPQP